MPRRRSGKQQSSFFDWADNTEETTTRALVDQLIANTHLYASSAAVMELLAFTARLRHMAPFNAMLLHMQKSVPTRKPNGWTKPLPALITDKTCYRHLLSAASYVLPAEIICSATST